MYFLTFCFPHQQASFQFWQFQKPGSIWSEDNSQKIKSTTWTSAGRDATSLSCELYLKVDHQPPIKFPSYQVPTIELPYCPVLYQSHKIEVDFTRCVLSHSSFNDRSEMSSLWSWPFKANMVRNTQNRRLSYYSCGIFLPDCISPILSRRTMINWPSLNFG